MRLLLLTLAIFGLLPLSAQETTPRKLTPETKDHKKTFGTRAGFKAGFNRTHIRGVETDGDKTGYIGGELYAGFFGESRFSERLSIGYELLFSWTDDYHYIEIPLHLKYHLNERWSTFAGPRIDVIVDRDDDFYDFKRVGMSAELGGQFNIKSWLFAEARYCKGFTKQVDNFFLDINSGRRNTLRLGLGLRF